MCKTSGAFLKFHRLVFTVVVGILVQLFLTTSIADVTDMKTDFIEGKVQIIEFNDHITRFRLVKNNAVVVVRNDLHLRLVENPYKLPETFSILAPMTAVKIVDGKVPLGYIRRYSLEHYISIREKYEKNMQSSSSPISEIFINKQDADYIFSLNRGEWEVYTKKMVHPDGWKVNLSSHETGTGVMSFDPNTGMGLSVQPLYKDNKGPPTMLIVGIYYPLGSLPEFTDAFKKSLEKATSDDMGPTYSVTATFAKMASLEGIELMVTRK